MHNLFVYGTLKRGRHNNGLLRRYNSEFVRETKTGPGFSLADAGVPIAFRTQGDHHVLGELYRINDLCLAMVDGLESNGSFYVRHEVPLACGVTAWMYLTRPPRSFRFHDIAPGPAHVWPIPEADL